MRIDKIRISGFTTYKGEGGELDLAALGAGIIAIAGPNGSGKTTLLEAVPGAVYRQTPSRGSIATMATVRDAKIELVGENGQPFTIRLDCDAHNGKQEAVIFNEAGEPLAGPKVRDFDAYIAEHFPSLDVYLASFFASQTGVGSVLKMTRSDRRALFGRLLGVERLELMATAARERGRATETQMAAAQASLEAVRAGAGDVDALEESLRTAKENEVAAAAALRKANEELKAAIAERDRLLASLAEAERAEKAYQEARRRLAAADENVAKLRAQASALEPVLSKAEEIRAAAKELRAAESSRGSIEGEVRAAEEEAKRAKLRSEDALKKTTAARGQEAELSKKVEALAAILGDAPKIKADASRLMELASEMDDVRESGEAAAETERQSQEAVDIRRHELQEAGRAHEAAARDLADVRARAKDAQKRLESAERSTAAVPCAAVLEDGVRAGCPALVGHFRTRDDARKILDTFGVDEARLLAAADAALAAKDKAEAEDRDAFKSKTAAATVAAELRTKYKGLREAVDRLRAADRSAALERAEAEAGALRPSLELARQTLKTAEVDYAKAFDEAIAAEGVAADKRRHQANLAVQLAGLKKADRIQELENAERAAAELKGRLETAEAAADEALAEANRLKAEIFTVEPALISDVALAAEDTHEAAARAAQEAGNQVARLEVQLKSAREAQAKAKALVDRLAPMERDLADWRWLARGLGREGVQALELDAAGPRVSGLANELLADAYGSRFQIRFETQAAKADGKGVKETFDVVVVDTERGREGNGEDLSGGEKVIVGEALGLAVGLFHAQAAGVSLGTVIRDETVGALDPENGERYLAMLRAFLRVGHVHQLLYVAHNPALVEMADAVVRIEDGRITVN